MFEKRLKEMYPHMKDITYDIADLYNYVDALADLVDEMTEVGPLGDIERDDRLALRVLAGDEVGGHLGADDRDLVEDDPVLLLLRLGLADRLHELEEVLREVRARHGGAVRGELLTEWRGRVDRTKCGLGRSTLIALVPLL